MATKAAPKPKAAARKPVKRVETIEFPLAMITAICDTLAHMRSDPPGHTGDECSTYRCHMEKLQAQAGEVRALLDPDAVEPVLDDPDA